MSSIGNLAYSLGRMTVLLAVAAYFVIYGYHYPTTFTVVFGVALIFTIGYKTSELGFKHALLLIPVTLFNYATEPIMSIKKRFGELWVDLVCMCILFTAVGLLTGSLVTYLYTYLYTLKQ